MGREGGREGGPEHTDKLRPAFRVVCKGQVVDTLGKEGTDQGICFLEETGESSFAQGGLEEEGEGLGGREGGREGKESQCLKNKRNLAGAFLPPSLPPSFLPSFLLGWMLAKQGAAIYHFSQALPPSLPPSLRLFHWMPFGQPQEGQEDTSRPR